MTQCSRLLLGDARPNTTSDYIITYCTTYCSFDEFVSLYCIVPKRHQMIESITVHQVHTVAYHGIAYSTVFHYVERGLNRHFTGNGPCPANRQLMFFISQTGLRTSICPKGPSVTSLDRCSRICSSDIYCNLRHISCSPHLS